MQENVFFPLRIDSVVILSCRFGMHLSWMGNPFLVEYHRSTPFRRSKSIDCHHSPPVENDEIGKLTTYGQNVHHPSERASSHCQTSLLFASTLLTYIPKLSFTFSCCFWSCKRGAGYVGGSGRVGSGLVWCVCMMSCDKPEGHSLSCSLSLRLFSHLRKMYEGIKGVIHLSNYLCRSVCPSPYEVFSLSHSSPTPSKQKNHRTMRRAMHA